MKKHSGGLKKSASGLSGNEWIMRFTQFSIEHAPEAIFWMGPDARFVYVNQTACDVLGYSKEELLNMTVHDIDPDLPPEVWPDRWKSLKKRGSYVIESHHRTKAGKVFPVSIAVNYLEFEGKEFNIVFARDISECVQANKILRASEEKFRLTFENAKDPIFWANPNTGLITNCNRAAEELLERDRSEIIGHHQTMLHPSNKAEFYADMFRKHIKQKGSIDDEAEIETKSGTIKPIHITASVTMVGEEPIIQGIFRDITERKKDEDKLRESEKRFRFLFDNFRDPITVYSTEGDILLINMAGARNLGGGPEDFVGRSLCEILPDKADVIKERNRTIVETGKGLDSEDEIEFSFGRRWFWSNHQPVSDKNGKIFAVQTISYDITERKVAEEALKESGEKYRTLVESANDAILLADAKTGIIIDANKMAEELIGFPVEKIIGMHQADIHPKEDEEYYRRLFEEGVRAETGFKRLAYVLRIDGERIPVQISASTLNLKGKKVMMGIFRDITELKRTEDILREDKIGLKKTVSEKTKQLRIALKELEDAKRLSDIGALAATVAHELRNPLGVINAAIYNVKRKCKDESLDSHLANIEKKIAESDKIIQNLLTFSRIKMPHYEQVAVLEVLEECISHSIHKYPKWDVEIIRNYHCKETDTIEADPLQMNEVCTNILDNAYQAFPDKRGKIEISIDFNYKEGRLNVVVKDYGIGIDEEDFGKVFEPFFTRKSKGIGLGLTVCHQVVALHRGTINIRSKKGEWTEIHVSLPIKKS